MAMQNVTVEEVGGKLVITIDPKVKLGPSSSGKSIIVATTGGNQPVTVGKRELVLGLNCYYKASK